MSEAKIRLSTEEKRLASNADLILTKNRILFSIQEMLGVVLEEQRAILSMDAQLPREVLMISPKISRGENYKGLPWLVLDHPRFFNKKDVFAIRTMFWWGNFFSTTLQLDGIYKVRFEKLLTENYSLLKEQGVYCCINDDPWEHHFDANNYRLIRDLSEKEFIGILGNNSFIKLGMKISLDNWDSIPTGVLRQFHFFVRLLRENNHD